MKNKTKRRLEEKENSRYRLVFTILDKGCYLPNKSASEVDLDYLYHKLSKNRSTLEAQLKYLQEDNFRRFGEYDGRSGYETYGYESEQSVKDTFYYIGDRVNVDFRIRWVLDWLDLQNSFV